MRFDLTDLRVFLHACEAGSMTQAAERSHLTLAAVSARIRALEEHIGVTLLHRNARGVTVTAAGAALARHAQVVFHQLGALQRDLTPSAEPVMRTTVLLGNSSALTRPLASIVASVLHAHPAARIAVRESGSEITVHALRTGAADIGIISDAADTKDLDHEVLGPDPLVVVTSPDHVLAGNAPRSFEESLTHDWVGWSEGSALHTHLAMQAFKAGTVIREKVTVPSAQEVLALVAQGVGISVMPATLVRGHAGPVSVVPLADVWARRQLLMCWKPPLGDAVAQSLAQAVKAQWCHQACS